MIPFCQYTANSLRFRDDGTFRVLYLSDVHERTDFFDPRTQDGIERLVAGENPDLVFFCGDNCNGPTITNADEMRKYLSIMTEPLVRRGIPFCHVFGNHDYETALTQEELMSVYREVPGCLSSSVEGIPGYTNFVLPVFSADGKDMLAAVWGLDTGHSINTLVPNLSKEACLTQPSSYWDIIRFEQLMWYWNTSMALENAAGHPIAGLMAFHVAAWEFNFMRTHTERLGVIGNTEEGYSLGALNSGAYAAFVQRGDIRSICCGHTHRNTCEADYCGIKMCSVGSVGYSAYGQDHLRGGRVVELHADDLSAVHTRMLYLAEYPGGNV